LVKRDVPFLGVNEVVETFGALFEAKFVAETAAKTAAKV